MFFACLCGPLFAAEFHTIRHVSDGDTIVLDDDTKVRLIGVDTPEIADQARNRDNARRYHADESTVRAFAEKAKKLVQVLTEDRRVRLEYDWQKKDKYNRTLAYVYIDTGYPVLSKFQAVDGYAYEAFGGEWYVFLNATLVKSGYGFAYTFFPFRYSEDFRTYGREAREKKRGLWRAG